MRKTILSMALVVPAVIAATYRPGSGALFLFGFVLIALSFILRRADAVKLPTQPAPGTRAPLVGTASGVLVLRHALYGQQQDHPR